MRLDELGPDGALHVTAARLAELRRDSSMHIGQCSRGPIVAIPVVADERMAGMSIYDNTMRLINDQITRYRLTYEREPSLIELSDGDYDAVVATATWIDDTDERKPVRDLSAPREGRTVFSVPVKANAELQRGQIKLT
ncbi:hypothetical protein [Mycobacterium aquaticum]|uniref:hypothetical protein n=1 Tax=Mycobacterium aquaticum TaxID=1927124 RepID=UPI00114E8986|nr:hypothetical protein [Mycobacterium aquaticum]